MDSKDATIGRDPLMKELDCLPPLNWREDSETSTDVGSNGGQSMFFVDSVPAQTFSEDDVEPARQSLSQSGSRSGSRRGSKDAAVAPHTPQEDIGGLLLQAFQIKDDYMQLQNRFSAMRDAAQEEVSSLRDELSTAYEQIWTLQGQLATMHATTADLRAQLTITPKKAAEKMAQGLLKVVGRSEPCNLRAACLEAWCNHVELTRVHRRQRVISVRARTKGEHYLLVSHCLHAWASHASEQKKAVANEEERQRQATQNTEAGHMFDTAVADDVYILTTEGSATSTRAPHRDRYHGLRTPEPLSRNHSRRTTPRCSPLGSPAPLQRPCTPGRTLPFGDSAVSLFGWLPEDVLHAVPQLAQPPPLPDMSSVVPKRH